MMITMRNDMLIWLAIAGTLASSSPTQSEKSFYLLRHMQNGALRMSRWHAALLELHLSSKLAAVIVEARFQR